MRALPAGTSCDDADSCTDEDRCDGDGTCTGTPNRACPPYDDVIDPMPDEDDARGGGDTTPEVVPDTAPDASTLWPDAVVQQDLQGPDAQDRSTNGGCNVGTSGAGWEGLLILGLALVVVCVRRRLVRATRS
jgi:hypothetical protein